VVIVAQHRENARLVVVREFRVPLGGYQYGFPAGLLDSGETLESACCRELFEETGLTVDRMIKSSPPVYSTSGMTDEAVSMVYVQCSGEISNAGNSSSEDIHPFLVSPEEALCLCHEPDQMLDVKTWLVLQAFGETGRVF
jgi:ADP-ribose pyrophosphatase